jgi:hypothetical protein
MGKVRFAMKRLALGIVCILFASALLLVSDLGGRTGTLAVSRPNGPRHVAVLQHASTPPLEDGRWYARPGHSSLAGSARKNARTEGAA